MLRWVDARLLVAVGFAVIAAGSWMDTGLTHDWANGDFLPSQIVSGVGLALALTALVTLVIANVTPPQAAAIAAVIQTARLIGIESGNASMPVCRSAGFACVGSVIDFPDRLPICGSPTACRRANPVNIAQRVRLE